MKAELIDHMGSDLTVVNAARVSFDKHKDKVDKSDEGLIHYLARHDHWTPFGHPAVTLRETVPLFVARQRFKHTVGFVYNETSRRYVDSQPEFYTPSVWRRRADNLKQGSSDEIIADGNKLFLFLEDHNDNMYYHELINICKEWYEAAIKKGVAPEQARMVLPQSMYTSYYVTGSLAAWARAYRLRSDSHAQLEIREFAKQWDEVISPLFPISWKELTC